jgi:hypothetical protein
MQAGVAIMQVESEMYGGDWDFTSKGWSEKSRIEFTFLVFLHRGVPPLPPGGDGIPENNDHWEV